MQRREFITLFGGTAATWPLAARAQQPKHVRRVGVITGDYETDPEVQVRIGAFQKRLADLGWIERRTIRFDFRWGANDIDRIQTTAADLVNLRPDAILSMGTPVTVELQRQTRTVPIVFTLVADPVASGLVESLAHPGANITGFTNYEYAIAGKWLKLLKESAPRIERFLVIQNPANVSAPGLLREIESGVRSFGAQVTTASALDAAELERAIEAFARQPNGGLIVLPDSATSNLRASIVALAAAHQLPAIYPFRYFALSGGLMSYGIDTVDPFQRAASYIDLILKGSAPGDLPVQAPNKFELVINMKTTKALRLTVPPNTLAIADEVID